MEITRGKSDNGTGAYLLPGGEAKLGLFERLGSKERPIFEELPLAGEMAEHMVASRWIGDQSEN